MLLLERGYTLSEAYALWRKRADAGVVTELAEHAGGDEGEGEGAMAEGSDEE
jgi:hypothetical protein